MVDNPHNTFIEVTVSAGGEEVKLHSSNDVIIDMQTNFVSDATKPKSIHFNFYDDTALLVENLLLNAGFKESAIKCRFGYVDGEASPLIRAQLTSFNSEFTARGINLSVECSCSGFGEDASSTIKSYQGTISEIVQQVVNDYNADANNTIKWKLVRNVPTVPVYDKDGTQKIYRCENMNPKEFITNVLIPEAVAAGINKGNYVFKEDVTKNPHEFYFQPSDYSAETTYYNPEVEASVNREDLTQSERDIISQNNSNDSKLSENISMVYYIGKSSDRVISFRPEYNESLTALYGGGKVTVLATDPRSGEPLSYDVVNKELGNVENTSTIKGDDTYVPFCGGSKSMSEIQSIARNLYDRAGAMAFPATLELVGSPTILPFKYIEIVVITPMNTVHFSSGKYEIREVNHNIGLGQFTTTLNLLKVGVQASGSEKSTRNGKQQSADVSYQEPDMSNYQGQEIAIMKFSRRDQRLYCYTKDAPTKPIMSFECRDAFVDGYNSEGLPYASLPNGSHQVVSAEIKSYGRAYGTFYIDVGDPRGRAIHGGGSSCADPFADRHEWFPTQGCLRMQNIDGKTLCTAINKQGTYPWLFVMDSLD